MSKISFVPVIVALATLTSVAFAADPTPTASATPATRKGPCREDAEKLCAGQTWGKGLGKCLKEHKAELSAGCQARIEKGKERMGEFREACEDDVEQYCGDVKPGHGAILRCLKGNQDKLSQGCRDGLSELKSKRAAMRGERRRHR